MNQQQTVVQLANSMIYLLLVRFALNDLPHAAGLLDNPNPIGFPNLTEYEEEPGEIAGTLRDQPQLKPLFTFLELYARMAKEKATPEDIHKAARMACPEARSLLRKYEDIRPEALSRIGLASYKENIEPIRARVKDCALLESDVEKIDNFAGTLHFLVMRATPSPEDLLPMPFGIDPENFEIQMLVHRILGIMGVGELEWKEIYEGR